MEVKVSLFLPLCQHNYFFKCKTTKTTADGRRVTSFDICLSPEEKKPPASKNAFDPVSPSLSTLQWCAPLGLGETAVEGQEERGHEETLWNVLEERRGAVNSPNGCGKVPPPPSFSRHLELSFVSRVWVYSVLLGQPTGTDAWQSTNGNHTRIDWRKQRGRER